MYKNLVISNNKKIWSKRFPNILVGDWCANNNHKFEKKDDYTVLSYHWNSKKKIKKDLKFLFKLYNYLLNNLSKSLNLYHKKFYPKRYWEILLSKWLWIYLIFFFDRWEIIKNITKKQKRIISKLIKYNDQYFIPENTAEFCGSNVFNNDWNHWVFSEILRFNKKIKLNYINIKKINPRIKKSKKNNINFSHKISNLLLNKLSSKKIFVQNLFYGKISEQISNFSLMQFRKKISHSYNLKKIKIDYKLRDKFLNFNKNINRNFENFIIFQIKNNLPKIFFESYSEANNVIEKLSLPAKPKLIMTSLDHHFNDYFKLYTAKNILLGSKFYISQHGGSYGISDLYMNELFDIKLSDKFLTWGWKEKNKKIRPFFCQKHYYINPKIIKRKNSKGLIIPIMEEPLSPGNIASGRPRTKMEINDYIEVIDNFLRGLNKNIKKQSAIKTFNNPLENYVYNSLKFKYPNLNVIKSDKNSLRFLKKFKLYVETVNSTGYLETLRSNFPTILIFNEQFCSIRKSVKKDMKMLKKVNILFDSPKKASEFVNKNYLQIDKWWNDKKLQSVREKFCNKFVRTSLNPYKDLKKII